MKTRVKRTDQEILEARQKLKDAFYPHGWATFVKPFVCLSETCDKMTCSAPAVMRIGLSIYGSLHEYDVCHKHGTRADGSSRHGDWCDGV